MDVTGEARGWVMRDVGPRQQGKICPEGLCVYSVCAANPSDSFSLPLFPAPGVTSSDVHFTKITWLLSGLWADEDGCGAGQHPTAVVQVRDDGGLDEASGDGDGEKRVDSKMCYRDRVSMIYSRTGPGG